MSTSPASVVRTGTDADVAACIDLWTSAVAARDGVSASTAVRARAAEKFRTPRVALVLLPGSPDGAALDGFALLTAPGTGRSTDPADAAYLSLLAVRPDLQARGVGRALLTAAVAAATAAGHPAVALHVLVDNARAVRLYEASGFGATDVAFPHALTGTPTRTYVHRG
ncbi:N-acetyltransferase [Curtobacterium sp. 9128]|uniref:GNAT family N-acetyltransferase n=1 Tax=Curtobacterium sp. 9128 TaxID=1793722 RepID=UPI0011A77260|nr:GNAT family N-acetyltransferase [Curtobacterium sp. 9128]